MLQEMGEINGSSALESFGSHLSEENVGSCDLKTFVYQTVTDADTIHLKVISSLSLEERTKLMKYFKLGKESSESSGGVNQAFLSARHEETLGKVLTFLGDFVEKTEIFQLDKLFKVEGEFESSFIQDFKKNMAHLKNIESMFGHKDVEKLKDSLWLCVDFIGHFRLCQSLEGVRFASSCAPGGDVFSNIGITMQIEEASQALNDCYNQIQEQVSYHKFNL